MASSIKTKQIDIDELIAKLTSAKSTLRNDGQLERIFFKQVGNELRIFTVPAYSELFPNYVGKIDIEFED